MSFQKLTREQLTGGAGARVYPPYRQFLAGLQTGEGGRGTTEAEGVSRHTIKARLTAAAPVLGMEIKFRRSPANEVVFEVVSAPERPRRGRRPKSEAAPTPD